ncbi:ATP-dependent metallopeptidase FtsH/Yme1/Tma family protein, partial [Chloroflexota bacterium]
MKSRWQRNSLIYLAILFAGVALVSLLLSSPQKPAEIPLSEAVAMSQSKKIVEIKVEDDALNITAADGTKFVAYKESNASIYDIEGLNLEGIVVDIKGSSGFN